MLRLSRAAALALLLLGGLATSARAEDPEPDDALRRPERLTVGVGDQFLGQLAPDGRTLYFVSNRSARSEIYAQDVEDGRARRVFDEGADVTWPRVSPDGKALLYVAFGEHATGQLCVRDLPGSGDRRCLDDPAATLLAEWIDGKRIVRVSRASLRGDLRVSEVTLGCRLASKPLFDRNLTSPAVSPDGRWLVYVPLDRSVAPAGPAPAAHAGQRLEAVRLDRDGPPEKLVLDLPGLTAQPAFARDGRSLYLTQFLTDSNHDGVIDARDHGVLFRVPFPSDQDDAPARAAAAAPVQLTDASWSCQYPMPAAARLVATCARDDDLDVYEMPLDGVVPGDWTADGLRREIAIARRPAEQLLLYQHLLARETDAAARQAVLMRLAMLHLSQDEHPAAEHYARRLGASPDPATRGLSAPLLVLVDHRRARSARERGRTIDTFAEEAARQLEELREGPGDGPATAALKRLVRSEIADAIGDKARARQELEAVVIDAGTPRPVLDAYLARADALYRELDDRGALVAALRRLATSKALAPDEQLDHARAAVRALIRGLPFDEAAAVLARDRVATPGAPELGFAQDLALATLAIRDAHPPAPARERLLALYEAQARPDRRRAVVLDAVQRAADTGADQVVEALAERYVDDLSPGTEARRQAERLYRKVILGRAFRRRAEGRLAEARADFDAVARRTGSFEALVASMDLRRGAGERPVDIQADLDADGDRTSPRARFARAYLLAQALPDLHGDARAAAVAEARSSLRASWAALKREPLARALYGAIMHQEYLRTGARDAADAASAHYLAALDLAGRDGRYRARILGDLGVLYTQVGNHRVALGYLEERARLPFTADAESLAVRLATARARLHVGREKDAADMADQALAMVDAAPALAPYRALALDRAALYGLAAERFARALALYDVEVPLLASAAVPASPAVARSRVVVRLARAAAAVGAGQPARALDDLDAIAPVLADPAVASALAPPLASAEKAARSYRSIAAGLRANANLALGRLDAAEAALVQSRALAVQTFAGSDRDEDLRALTLAEARLADSARARRDLPAAARWLGLALGHADGLPARTHAALDGDQLHVLRLGAELQAFARAPLPFDLPARLGDAHDKMVAQRDPSYRAYARWFEIHLALAAPAGAAPGAPPPR